MKRLVRKSVLPRPAAATAPAGATLSEVLVSLLIMSIGVVTLATLFPISILRSIQATQLTNATNLRYNVDAIIDIFPGLIHDPDGNGNTREHNNTGFVVDPHGFHQIADIDSGLSGNFGCYPNPNYPGLNEPEFLPAPQVRRFRFNFNANEAATLASLPDSFVHYVTATPVAPTWPYGGAGTTFVRLSSEVDLSAIESAITASLDPPPRILLFGSNGKFSQTRTIESIDTTTNQVAWDSTRPINYEIESVRIETFDRRYTWMLTVRKGRWDTAQIDAVIFFNRSFDPNDERVYPATITRATQSNGIVGADGEPGFAGVDDDGNGTVDDATEAGAAGSDDNRTITVDLSSATTKPFYRPGSYVFDVANARWYRIESVQNETPNSINPTSVDLVIERDILDNGSAGVILMPGIVKVFPLSNR